MISRAVAVAVVAAVVGCRARFPAAVALVVLLASGGGIARADDALARLSDGDLVGRHRHALAAANAAYVAEDWEAGRDAFASAAAIARALAARGTRPVDVVQSIATPLYNAACCAARAGDTGAGHRLLREAVEAGFDDLPLVQRDRDLDALRVDGGAWERSVEALVRRVAAFSEGHAEGRIIAPPRGGFFARMRGDREPSPTGCIVALHGAGGNVEAIASFWERVGERLGVVVVLVRAPIAFGRGAFRWRQDQPAEDAELIASWVARAVAAHPTIAPSRTVLAGYSQGGGQAVLLALGGPGSWADVIAIGPYVQVAQRGRLEEPSIAGAGGVRLALIVGEREEAAILEAARALHARDGTGGLAVRLRVVPDVGHALAPSLVEDVVAAWEWLEATRAPAAMPAEP